MAPEAGRAELAAIEGAGLAAWIDAAGYEALLERWRFAPAGHPMFTDPVLYDRFRAAMAREYPGAAGHAAASKRVGWGPR